MCSGQKKFKNDWKWSMAGLAMSEGECRVLLEAVLRFSRWQSAIGLALLLFQQYLKQKSWPFLPLKILLYFPTKGKTLIT